MAKAGNKIPGWEQIEPESISIMRKPNWKSKIKLKVIDLMIFTRQFATLIDAGVPVDQSLKILGKATKSQMLMLLTFELHRLVGGGGSLSESMSKFKRVFTEMYVNMMTVAEVTGDLPGVLLELASNMEGAVRIKTKIKSAMTYPMISMAMVIVIATGLVIFVVPKFEAMFVMVKGTLPLPTRVLIALSNAIRNHSLAVILVLGAVIFIFRKLVRTNRGRYLMDIFKIKAPVMGHIVLEAVIANFSRTLGTLLRCGVPILKSLEIVRKTVGNRVMEIAIEKVMDTVRGGGTLAEVFEKQPVIPLMVTRMIDIGERTGQLESLLEKVCNFYEERVEAAIEGMTALIEPLLVAVLGIVVGGIMMAIFMPIIKIASSVGN